MSGNQETGNGGRKIFALAVLTALGFAGNWATLPIAYSVAFIFGSIFPIIAVRLFGIRWGVAAATVASGSTYFLWGHPYAMVIFFAEILWIACALRRGRTNILLIDSLFWALPGLALVYLLYAGAMNLGAQSATIIFLKQALNGVFNALVASIILSWVPLERWLKLENTRQRVSYSTILLQVTTAFLVIPLIGMLLFTNYKEISSRHEIVSQRVKANAHEIDWVVGRWLRTNLDAVRAVADLGRKYPLRPSPLLQEEIREIKELFPVFHNMSLLDETATTVAFYPPRNEKGESTVGLSFSDRPFYKQSKETMKPVISNVFMGRGGVFKPIFTMSVPIVNNGVFAGSGLGAINLDRLYTLMEEFSRYSEMTYTILDQNNTIVISSLPGRKPLEKLPEREESIKESAVQGVFLKVPGVRKNMSTIDAWNDAVYFTKIPIEGSGWTLLVEYPVAPLQKYFYSFTIKNMAIVAALFVLALIVSVLLSGQMARTPITLATISRDIPGQIEKRMPITWPETHVAEMAELIENFKETAEALSNQIAEVKRANYQLEKRVQERTEALRLTSERLALAAESARLGVWDWDVKQDILVWDDWMYRLYGLEKDGFSGTYRAWTRGLHPDDLTKGNDDVLRALRGEEELNTQFRIVRPDGRVRYIKANALVIRDADNTPLRMIGTNYDVTEREETERELRDSRQRLSQIIDFLPDATLVVDREGIVIAWNRAMEIMTGIRQEEMVGKGDYEYALPLYNERRPMLIDLVLHPDSAIEDQYTAIWRVGEIIFGEAFTPNLPSGNAHLYATASVLHDSRGEIIAAIECIRDNTERKRAEEELVRSKEDLERVNRMLQEASAQANAMAVEAQIANTAKSEFLANMSHEIRTPMNGIIGMTGLLLDTDLTPEQRRSAETVRISGESLLGLINDILDFSKIEAGKLDLEILDFDLENLLEDFAATMAMRAHDKGLELVSAVPLSVPLLLKGDPGRLRQILTNLVGNAVKFTPSGEIVIRVTKESETGEQVMLRFSVRDTGIGIPEEKISLLFQKFTQADTSTTRKYGGTGLGLAISRQLVALMGGTIGVTSEEGRGSEFWFTARLGRQAESGPRTYAPADLSGVKVLVVDDNETNREILVELLTSWSMLPIAVAGGDEALAVLHEKPFRLAIIDMQMPGMDGEALGRAIKANADHSRTTMVMLTSLGTRGDAKRFEEIGFAAYLTKPVRHQELKNVLSMVLAHRSRTDPIATRHSALDRLVPFAGSKARILLAEDNITNQQVALGILKKLGLHADAVANGAEAVKALEDIPYDLVLMDVQMPVMDGLKATRLIRDPLSGVLNHAVPVIAMTAHAMQGDRETCLAAGMDDYVSKPVAPRVLLERLEKWLTGSGKKSDMEERPHDALIWDRAGMVERLMDDEDLVAMVAGSFLSDMPGQIAALRESIEAGKAYEIERQAHTIKGASANIGGEQVRKIAYEIEKAAKAGDLAGSARRLPELERSFVVLRGEMERGVGTRPSTREG